MALGMLKEGAQIEFQSTKGTGWLCYKDDDGPPMEGGYLVTLINQNQHWHNVRMYRADVRQFFRVPTQGLAPHRKPPRWSEIRPSVVGYRKH